ncbi:MAG: hypothetical protein IT567_06975, partial [Alphaproteobacteria bacterium]|nr:hypothetical protein [Alphaproteobacteria bacterium]
MAAFWESPLSPGQQQQQLLFAVCALTRGDRARYYEYDENRNLTRCADVLIDTEEPGALPDRFDATEAALLSPDASPTQRAIDTGQLLLYPVAGPDGATPKGVIAVEKVRRAGRGFSAMPDGTHDGNDITFSPQRLDMAATVLGAFSCFMFPQDRFLIRRAEERFAKPEERIAFYDALAEPMLRYMAESDPREELAKHLRNVPELVEIVLRALDAATTGPFRNVTLGDEGVRLIKALAGVHDIGKMFHRRGEIPFLPELGQDAGFVIRNQAHPEFSLRIL